MCMHVCVCFKVAVWFCSELTRAPEVIKIRQWRRPLERAGALRLLWLCKEMVCAVACTCVYVPVNVLEGRGNV